MTPVALRLFQSGHCTHPEFIVIQGGRRSSVKIPALWALIEHPVQGHVLFDTGYAPRFYRETERFPYNLYGRITPVCVDQAVSAAAQLADRGISPDSIRCVIVSHFHADHIGGVKDFTQAQFLYAKQAFDAVANLSGWRALKAGFLPGLLPPDFRSRSVTFDLDGAHPFAAIAPFERGIDLLGDGSLIGVHLPGHARGQMGIFLQTTAGETVLLAADACWFSDAYRQLRPPHRLAHLALDDPAAYWSTLNQLHRLHAQRPAVRIVPSHCPEVRDRWVEGNTP